MRTTEEQLKEINQRVNTIQKQRSLRRQIALDLASGGSCLILLVVVCIWIPKLTEQEIENTASNYGGLLLSAPYLGYVLVGILAFTLGICITLLCFHYKKLKQQRQERK